MTEASGELVLAIETSCDETAVAVCDGEGRIIASQVASQVLLHAPYGGVVPELASRNHNRDLKPLILATLAESNLRWSDVGVVAATSGPGLASSLLIGDTTAKAIAAALECPFYSINHMEGHLLSPFIGEGLEIPAHTALIVSGGHTLLVEVRGVDHYEVLGSTKDDAAGEAFDKVGKMMGLPYPGGPEVSKQAGGGDPTRFDFPRSMLDSKDLNFSFSGLKTAVRYTLDKLPDPLSAQDCQDVCASFQEAVIDVLVGKLEMASLQNGSEIFAVSGGVSCNEGLRSKCSELEKRNGWALKMAPKEFTTDNAAMIAFAAAARRNAGVPGSPLNADIDPNLRLGAPGS